MGYWAAGAIIAATVAPFAVAPAASARAQAQSPAGLALSVTSVNPSYATPGSMITIRGRVWNGGRTTINNLSLRLYFSNFAFGSRTALQSFAAGAGVTQQPLDVAPKTIGKLPARNGVGWNLVG